jgi:hypothetical protein
MPPNSASFTHAANHAQGVDVGRVCADYLAKCVVAKDQIGRHAALDLAGAWNSDFYSAGGGDAVWRDLKRMPSRKVTVLPMKT